MSIKKAVTAGFITGAVSLVAAGVANDASAMDTDKEKCYGVVKAGHNDCGAKDGSHSCMGQATADGSEAEFIALPKGVCDKLVSGSTGIITEEDVSHDHEKKEM